MHIVINFKNTNPTFINLQRNIGKCHNFNFDLNKRGYWIHREDMENGNFVGCISAGSNFSLTATVLEGVRLIRMDEEERHVAFNKPVKLRHQILTFVEGKNQWATINPMVPFWEDATVPPEDFPDNWRVIYGNMHPDIKSYLKQVEGLTAYNELLKSDALAITDTDEIRRSDVIYNIGRKNTGLSFLAGNTPTLNDTAWVVKLENGQIIPVTNTIFKDKFDMSLEEVTSGEKFPKEIEWLVKYQRSFNFYFNPEGYNDLATFIRSEMGSLLINLHQLNCNDFIEIINSYFNQINKDDSTQTNFVSLDEFIRDSKMFKEIDKDTLINLWCIGDEVLFITDANINNHHYYSFACGLASHINKDPELMNLLNDTARNWVSGIIEELW